MYPINHVNTEALTTGWVIYQGLIVTCTCIAQRIYVVSCCVDSKGSLIKTSACANSPVAEVPPPTPGIDTVIVSIYYHNNCQRKDTQPRWCKG
jgi:hypothetical protein